MLSVTSSLSRGDSSSSGRYQAASSPALSLYSRSSEKRKSSVMRKSSSSALRLTSALAGLHPLQLRRPGPVALDGALEIVEAPGVLAQGDVHAQVFLRYPVEGIDLRGLFAGGRDGVVRLLQGEEQAPELFVGALVYPAQAGAVLEEEEAQALAVAHVLKAVVDLLGEEGGRVLLLAGAEVGVGPEALLLAGQALPAACSDCP